MTDLTTLAEQCEAASGADRALDALIWCAINGKRYRGHNPAYGEAHLTQVEYTEPPKRTRLVTGGRGGLPHALPVTASIDAALTLVPEGWTGLIPVRGGRSEEAWLWPEAGTMYKGYRCTAATPELALCAAALRARGDCHE